MHLLASVQQQSLDLRQGTISRAVGGHANQRRLDKVVEAAKEKAEHSRRTDDPDGRTGELLLQQTASVLQTPWRPTVDLLVLGVHGSFQVLEKGERVCVCVCVCV